MTHRIFCHITSNWCGRPLISRQVAVNLVGDTTTESVDLSAWESDLSERHQRLTWGEQCYDTSQRLLNFHAFHDCSHGGCPPERLADGGSEAVKPGSNILRMTQMP